MTKKMKAIALVYLEIRDDLIIGKPFRVKPRGVVCTRCAADYIPASDGGSDRALFPCQAHRHGKDHIILRWAEVEGERFGYLADTATNTDEYNNLLDIQWREYAND